MVTGMIFLSALRAALEGRKLTLGAELRTEELEALFSMAGTHGVLPLVFEAVQLPASADAGCRAVCNATKRTVMQLVMLQTLRTHGFLELNQALQAAGIRPLVVKGIVCRSLYPQPDHRQSSDEDLLIPPEQWEACHRALLQFGMKTQLQGQALADAYEVPYRMEGSPLYIELHRHLFPPESEAYGDLNGFFTHVHGAAAAEMLQGGTVYTMAPTDHMLYLICHALKHFLHSGFGIRQICDMVMYANAYGDRIDWIRVLEACRKIRAERFTAAVFRIGEAYLVFDPEKAQYPLCWRELPVDEGPMLEDILGAGLYGGASLSRKHSSSITLDSVVAQKQGKRAKGPWSAMFPPAKSLEQRYGYLKKHPYLLPVAWCDRGLTYLRGTKKTDGNTPAEALKLGAERVKLLREYGIIE